MFASWKAFIVATAFAACGCSKANEPPHVTAPASTARRAFVDPIPIDITALEKIVQDTTSGSAAHDVAAKRLRALLAVSRPASNRAPEERDEYASTHSKAGTDAARREALFALARAYQRSGDQRRGAQVYLSLVCPRSYRYPVPVDEQGADTLLVKAQDHPDAFWSAWETRHSSPLDRPQPRAKKAPPTPASETDELRYRTIFGSACTPPESANFSSKDSELLAQSWFAIAMFYAFGYEAEAGPYRVHRSLEALGHARQWAERAGARELAVIAELWTSYGEYELGRQQAATQTSVRVLDALERLRSRGLRSVLSPWAARITASALTFADFQGPPPEYPHIYRADTLDREANPRIAEDKMMIGIERVQDLTLFPHTRPWLPAIYVALIDEYTQFSQLRAAVSASDAFLQGFPLHPDVPLVKEDQANAFFKLNLYERDQSSEKLQHWDRADAAFSHVATSFGPGSPWIRANAGDSQALARATQAAARAQKQLAESRKARAAYHLRSR